MIAAERKLLDSNKSAASEAEASGAEASGTEASGAEATWAETTGAEATGAEATVAEAPGAEAASKVIDEVIVAKAAAGEDEHTDGEPFLLEFVNLKSIGTSGLLESLESEPQRLQSLE